jgi:urease accessory protein
MLPLTTRPAEITPEDAEAAVVTLPGLEPVALLRLLQLASPALPIGAFAFSQGLEMAVELGWVTGEESARSWLLGSLTDGLARLELPLAVRFHAAWCTGDRGAVERCSELLLASRETRERRLEEAQLGRALARLLENQGIVAAAGWVDSGHVTQVGMFTLGAASFGIPPDATLFGFAFAWAEAQVGAASRLVPLGQLAAQRTLASAVGAIPAAVALARSLPDDALGATLPGLALASSLHETQYTRLFKS